MTLLDNRLPEERRIITSVIHRRGQTTNQLLKPFQQIIRCWRGNIIELLYHLYQDLPKLLCFSQHHISQSERHFINIEKYPIGAKYCRRKFKKDGVSIFIQSHRQLTTKILINIV
jgi:hypothetical protein